MADASVRLYLPPSLAENEITKYPLLVHVYGGPGSQQVNERFQINWGYHLATSKNIIYGVIDGRGSGFKGDKMLYELYHRLGTVEVEDQIQVTRYVKPSVLIVASHGTRMNTSVFATTTDGCTNDSRSLTAKRLAFGAGATEAM